MATISSVFKMQDNATKTFSSVANAMDNVIDKADMLANKSSNLGAGVSTINPALNQAISKYNELTSKQDRINEKIEMMSRQEKLLVNDLNREKSAYNQNEKAIFKIEKNLMNVRNSKQDLINKSDKLTEEILNQANAVNKVANNTDKIKVPQKDAESGFGKWGARIVALNQGLQLTQTIARGIGQVFEFSDQLTLTKTRLDMINDGLQTTQELQDKVYASAARSRSSYQDMARDVAKLGMLAGDVFKNNDEIIAFNELLNKSFTVSGSTQQEISSSMYQLTQAMSSGLLQGDELRSLREGAPMLYQAIADYMGVTKGELKELGAEGKITADIIKNAIFTAGDEVEEKFKEMPMTFAQAGTQIQNAWAYSMQQVSDKFNEVLNNESVQQFLQNIVTGITIVGNVISSIAQLIIDVVGNIITFISDNWGVISIILTTLLILILPGILAGLWNIITALITLAAHALIAGVKMLISMMMALGPIGLIIVIILAVIVALKMLGVSFETVFSYIGGVVGVAVAGIYNIFLGLLDLVLGIINQFGRQWTAFANFFRNIFKDPISTIIYGFRDMANGVLSIIKTVASAIDKVFGSNLAKGVQGWMNGVDKLANKAAKKYGNGKYKGKEWTDLTSESLGLSRVDYGSAWNTGFSVGGNIGSSLDSMVDSLGGILDGLGNTGNPNNLLDQYGGYDYSSMIDPNGNLPVSINDDKTGSKEVDISDEDLKMLKDIATRDYMLNYKHITPNVNIQFGDVKETADINAIKDELDKMMQEELSELYVVEEA